VTVEIPIIGMNHDSQPSIETTILGVPAIAFPIAGNISRSRGGRGKQSGEAEAGNSYRAQDVFTQMDGLLL
jgi:hypothetical protein